MKDILLQLAAGAKVNTVGGGGDTLQADVIGIINFIISILGIVCVVVIIIGGVYYMTSSGDSGKVKKGKDTILYGIIGLIICALSFVIVNFVISDILKQNGGTQVEGGTGTDNIQNS